MPRDDDFALAKHVRQSMYLRNHTPEKKDGYAAGLPVWVYRKDAKGAMLIPAKPDSHRPCKAESSTVTHKETQTFAGTNPQKYRCVGIR